MRHQNPPYVHAHENRHGTPVYYLRRPGQKKIRLRVPKGALPWSKPFMEVYEAAMAEAPALEPIGINRTVPGSVSAALVSYYQAPAFTKGLARGTQINRRGTLESFRAEHGDKRIALIHSTAVQKILNTRSPAAARNLKKALRGFLNHCLSLGMIKDDPLAGIKLAQIKSRGHHPWEAEECEQFERHHALGTRARLAYELLLQAGQSRCDVVRMGRQHIRNGMMSMHRQKTGVMFNVEITPRLRAAIDAMPGSNHLTFLVTHQGEPFSPKGFGIWFKKVCRQAGLPERCTTHGLRKAAATYFAELGATDHQLMAWFGWTSISQAQVYTKSANRKLMAASAGKLMRDKSSTGIGSPVDPVSQTDAQAIDNTEAKK